MLKMLIILCAGTIVLFGQSQRTDVFSAGGGMAANASYSNFGVFGQALSVGSSNANYINNEGFIYAQDFIPLVAESFVSNDYNSETPEWLTTHFDNLDEAIAATKLAGTINISNYTYTGDVDFTYFTVIIGDEDFILNGNVTGGSVQTPSTGKLVLPASQSGTMTYPLSDGVNNFTVQITPVNDPEGQPIEVKIQPRNETPAADGMLSLDLWEISGPPNLDATLVFNLPDASIQGGTLPDNVMIRYWNGERYVGISSDNVIIVDNGTYYTITITNVNQF